MPVLPGFNRIALTFLELAVFSEDKNRGLIRAGCVASQRTVVVTLQSLHFPPECSTSHVLSFGWSNWKRIKFQRTMGALLGRCHGRIRTCLEPGTVTRPHQNYCAYFSGCFRGAACLGHLDTFLLYFTYFIVKIFGRCYKKKQHDFFSPLALQGPVLLEYSKLQAHSTVATMAIGRRQNGSGSSLQ